MTSKPRLDQELLARGLAISREQAQRLIRAGKVRDKAGNILDKPGTFIKSNLELKLEIPPRFVSRGGEKLLAGLKAFPINVNGRICFDGGISTGGFTDCLLQHGAERVYGVDVGYGQTAWSLRIDERVVLKERTNIRYIDPKTFFLSGEPLPTLAVTDVSFISLRLILPVLRSLLISPGSEALVLIKPQFEVGKEKVGKGGVVRDPNSHYNAIKSVIKSALEQNWHPNGIIASPLVGPTGNHEYLLWLAEKQIYELPDLKEYTIKTVKQVS